MTGSAEEVEIGWSWGCKRLRSQLEALSQKNKREQNTRVDLKPPHILTHTCTPPCTRVCTHPRLHVENTTQMLRFVESSHTNCLRDSDHGKRI